MKELRELFDSIIKKALSSTEYQEYRRLLQANAQVRDAQIWVKSGQKMRLVDVGLGLSDGSFVDNGNGAASFNIREGNVLTHFKLTP